jgi:hypothetical protein
LPRKVAAPAPEKKTAAKPRTAHAPAARERKRAAPKAATLPSAFGTSPYQAEIAEAAYFLWLQRDGQHGSHEDDWLKAEALVREKYSA